MENKLFFPRHLSTGCSKTGYDPITLILSDLKFSRNPDFCRRQYLLKKHCFFTYRFLKATGQLENTLINYCEANSHFSFLEEASYQFLTWLSKNTIGLTSVIARFELGLTIINKDEIYEDKIVWPCDPLPLIYGLIQGNLSKESIRSGEFSMVLSDKIVGGFDVEYCLGQNDL